MGFADDGVPGDVKLGGALISTLRIFRLD